MVHTKKNHKGIVRGIAGKAQSNQIGAVNISVGGKIHKIDNVWLIDKRISKFSLLSISSLTKQLKLIVVFDENGAYVAIRKDSKTIQLIEQIASVRNGLYILNKGLIESKGQGKLITANHVLAANSYQPFYSEILVHNRLGHICKSYMLEMLRVKTLHGIDHLTKANIKMLVGKGCANPCTGCIAKQNREPKSRRVRGPNRPPKDSQVSQVEPARTVATDTFGPFFPNYYGIKYAQLFIHLRSRKVWLFGMKKKAEFPRALEEYLITYKRTYPDKMLPDIYRSSHVATFNTNTDYTIRIIRSDRAPEYTTKQAQDLYREFGIKHVQTVPHSSWENGFAERAIQTVNKIASAQLIAAKFPPEEYKHLYWQSLRHACTVYNMCPHKGLKFLCPDEAWTNVKPHIDHIRTFGATVFEYLNATQRLDGKRSRRFRIGIYLGNTPGVDKDRPAMRIYVPHMNQIYIRRSAILDESLSHDESRLKKLRNGAHYVNIQNEFTKVLMPTKPPSFEGGADEWSKQGDSYTYNKDDFTEINDTTSTKTKPLRKMHLRSDGPVKEVVTLQLRFKKNAKRSEKIKVISVNNLIAVMEVDYNWILKATQHDQYKLTMKQFDNPTIAEAKLRADWPLWRDAIEKEFKQLKQRGTWKEVDANQVEKRPLGTKLVLKIKRDARTNEIEKYKARLTVKGYRQVQGYDYQKTSSPVTVYATFLFLLAHAVKHERKLKTMDFAGAFLYPYLDEDIYITIPEFYECKPDTLLKLRKSLYGLKQASREWHLAVTKALKEIGFKQAPIELDQCLLHHEEFDIYLCMHVDDCFMSYTDEESIEKVKKLLEAKKFEFSVVEELKKGLGLSIKQDKDEIIISQPQYVDFMLNEFKDHLIQSKRRSTMRTPLKKVI